MTWMLLPFRRYARFSGRSQRKEYWMFVLFNLIAVLLLSVMDGVLGLGGHAATYDIATPAGVAAGASTRGGLLTNLYSLAILVPSLAVGVRRLHDIDRTGWWLAVPVGLMLLASLSIVGTPPLGPVFGLLAALAGVSGIIAIVLFVWACLDGTAGPNRFGPDPKGR